MKHITQFVLFLLAATFCCCCSGGEETKSVGDVFDQINNYVETTGDIDRAKARVAAAEDSDSITDTQRQFFDAVLVFRSTLNYDTVRSICQRLAERRDVKVDKHLLYHIHSLLTAAAEANGSFGDMIQFASITRNLAHDIGKKAKEQEMVGTMGYGMVLMGRDSEGLQMIDKALAALQKQNDWTGCNNFIVLSKLKVNALDYISRYDDMLGVSRNALMLIGRMERNPKAVKGLPEAWTADNAVMKSALSMYRAQFYAYMAYAYAKTGRRSEAMESLADFDRLPFSKTNQGKRTIVYALGELRLYDRMLAAYKAIDKEQKGDTVSVDYRDELYLKANAASASGDYMLSHTYLQRALNLTDKLFKMRDRDQMQRTLSAYKVNEERMKSNSASAAARLMFVIFVCMFIVVVMVLYFMIRTNRQSHSLLRKNRTLVLMIQSVYDYQEKYKELLRKSEGLADETEENGDKKREEALEKLNAPSVNIYEANSDAHLFARMDNAIREGEMYLNPDFQRQTLVDELGFDRNKIGKLIHDYSGFPNLSAYINSFRLEYACRLLLRGDARVTVEDVARQSGFTTLRTFQRLFKETYGMTPAEFRVAQ